MISLLKIPEGWTLTMQNPLNKIFKVDNIWFVRSPRTYILPAHNKCCGFDELSSI